ncbi:MAG: MBL fold metallo-hydrolase [Phyllobacterium sp.]
MSLPFTADLAMRPNVQGFYDEATSALSYVVRDPASTACAVIDPVLDIDYAAGHISHQSADHIIDYVKENGLTVEWLIETHVHADHISAAHYIREKIGGRIGIGHNVTKVQAIFADIFNETDGFKRDGSQFDHLFQDGESYRIGTLTGHTMDTPGHTPACMTHVIGDAAFVADTLFMPDGGTARADFRGGGARALYRSIQRILELPDAARVFVCHDYKPNGREPRWETSVGEQRRTNIHLASNPSEDEFVAMREARDATLPMPRLILPSLQINMRAGTMPPPDKDGRIFLKVPINTL